MKKNETRQVRCGDVLIGGGAPVSIQSMTNVDSRDERALTEQIARLADAGCQIVRISVPDAEAAEVFGSVKRKFQRLPLVADIHFDYRMAIEAIRQGADKIRINPGNIGGPERVREVVQAAKEREIPIRVGVNSGSLEKPILTKYGGVTAAALAESALYNLAMIEDLGYDRLVVSLKASDVTLNYEAHRAFGSADRCAGAHRDYRGGHTETRQAEIGDRHRFAAAMRHWRYDAGFPDGRPGGRSAVCEGNPAHAGDADILHRSGVVSDLRQNEDQSGGACQ